MSWWVVEITRDFTAVNSDVEKAWDFTAVNCDVEKAREFIAVDCLREKTRTDEITMSQFLASGIQKLLGAPRETTCHVIKSSKVVEVVKWSRYVFYLPGDIPISYGSPEL